MLNRGPSWWLWQYQYVCCAPVLVSFVIIIAGEQTYLCRKPKTCQCFLQMGLERRDHDEHQCLAVAAQAVLQQVSQLGVTVRHVARSATKSLNDVAQAAQTLVDVLGFLHTVALSL